MANIYSTLKINKLYHEVCYRKDNRDRDKSIIIVVAMTLVASAPRIINCQFLD